MRSPSQSFRPAARHAILAGAAVAAAIAAAWTAPSVGQGPPVSPQFNPPGRSIAHATSEPGESDPTPLTPSTPDMKAVQDLLGRAADDATTPGRSAELITLLARRDRDRIGSPAGWADVDRAADGFRDAWRARFGLSFKLADKIPIVITEPVVHVTSMTPTDAAPSTQPRSSRRQSVTVELSDPGRHSVATLHLVNEGKGKAEWHFDVPDAVTAAALHDSLLRHLTAVTADQSAWPTDVDQAYVYVTQHVLAALAEASPAPR